MTSIYNITSVYEFDDVQDKAKLGVPKQIIIYTEDEEKAEI